MRAGGGGGGGRTVPRARDDLIKLVHDSKKEADSQRLDSDVNQLLGRILATAERDSERVQECLGDIERALENVADMERFLFGGSVAKHTYVDGLSDIDALAILKEEDVEEKSPDAILSQFERALRSNLTYDKVRSIEKGRMAVTVTYRDGLEIQLLPASRKGNIIAISDASASGWKETNPKLFQKALTAANQRLNGCLVPTIKLIKSMVSDFPENKRLSGYHIESLALDAIKGYRAAKTPKALLIHIVDHASDRVMRSIRDATGQSRIVDSYLGDASSTERVAISQALAGISRRLKAAISVDQWASILEP